MQNGTLDLSGAEVVANLPLNGPCALWFDHHVSNKPDQAYDGLFRVAPSAAGLIYEYFTDRLGAAYQELVRQTDKIDSAQLTLDEILRPEAYPFVLLSMTVFSRHPSDLSYCDHLVSLLRSRSIDHVMKDKQVIRRCRQVVANNREYEVFLRRFTVMQAHISITDFRSLMPAPDGNRFLVYSLFPDAVVNVKVFNENNQTVIKLGHSILNRGCHVNVGQLLATYGGGGHKGAGACRVEPAQGDQILQKIIQILIKN
jgi:hypothetical protein